MNFLFLYFLSFYLEHTQTLPLWENIPVRTAMLQCNSISSISNSVPNGVEGAIRVIDSYILQYSCIPHESIVSIFYLEKHGEQKNKIGFKVEILSNKDRTKKNCISIYLIVQKKKNSRSHISKHLFKMRIWLLVNL